MTLEKVTTLPADLKDWVLEDPALSAVIHGLLSRPGVLEHIRDAEPGGAHLVLTTDVRGLADFRCDRCSAYAPTTLSAFVVAVGRGLRPPEGGLMEAAAVSLLLVLCRRCTSEMFSAEHGAAATTTTTTTTTSTGRAGHGRPRPATEDGKRTG